MFLFLSKIVENSCIGTAKGNNIDVIYIRRNIATTISNYMDPVSYDLTNNFEKMPLLMALLTHLLATGRDGQTCYTWHVGCLATSVAKKPERWKYSIKQHICYNKYITIFVIWTMFLFQVIRLMALLIGWPTYIQWKKYYTWLREWLKRNESNRANWFQTRFFSLVYL